MLWDTHMHTNHSGDSDAAAEAMIVSALARGLDGLCFTDHLDYDYPVEPELFLLDIPLYIEETALLREKYEGKIQIRQGIEIGLQPQLTAKNRDVAASFPFDFVIGSSHVAARTPRIGSILSRSWKI